MKNHLRHIRIFRIAALWFCLTAVFFLTGCSPNLALNQKYIYPTLRYSYGTPVSTDLGEYVDLSALSEEDLDYVLHHTEVEYDGVTVQGKEYDEPGDYALTIYYNGRQYRRFDISVTDTEPPAFTRADDAYAIEGYDLEEQELEERIEAMFEVEDNTANVDIEIRHDPIDTDHAGDYPVHAVATDKSGNRAAADAVFHVQKPAYGMQGTYVFVSISEQVLAFFVDGENVLETPVVSGTAGRYDTPTGSFRLLNKGMYVTLKGRDYKVKVTYWMAFLGAEFGLHSAEWRGVFGGSIYQYSGSHGCVNMPVWAAGELYDQIEIGTPIIIVP